MSTTEPTKLSRNDARYPATLLNLFGSLLPPDIWVAGNVSLLGEKAVGFCVSRKASDRGLEVAADCARQLSEAGVIVVSGYAPGVDMASHEGALKMGGVRSLCSQRASIVLEAREQGGNLNAGYSALQLGKPLFVALYDDMNGSRDGNQRLIQEGGKPLLRNRATSQAQMQEVFANVGLAN